MEKNAKRLNKLASHSSVLSMRSLRFFKEKFITHAQSARVQCEYIKSITLCLRTYEHTIKNELEIIIIIIKKMKSNKNNYWNGINLSRIFTYPPNMLHIKNILVMRCN